MSSNGATSTPRRAKTCQSNFTFWPIFSTPGSSSSGFSSAIASASAIWPGQQPAAARTGRRSPALMADRNVAGLARRDGERHADELGLHRIERGRFGVEGDERPPRAARAIQPSSVVGVADGLRKRRRRSARRALPPRARRRAPAASRVDVGGRAAADGRRRGGGGRVGRTPRLRAPIGSPLRPRQPPGPTKRGSGSIAAASRPAEVGDALA